MASKAEQTPQKEEMPEKEGPETLPDSPLLDLSNAAVTKLIRSAKNRGYVTHDQINSVLPSEEVNSEQIEDVFAMFSEMGVRVVETEEPSEEGEEQREEADEGAAARVRALSRGRGHRAPSSRASQAPISGMPRCRAVLTGFAR
jgi:RNA polymerase primary sigma factor